MIFRPRLRVGSEPYFDLCLLCNNLHHDHSFIVFPLRAQLRDAELRAERRGDDLSPRRGDRHAETA